VYRRYLVISVLSVLLTLLAVEVALRLLIALPACDDSLHARFRQTIDGVSADVTYDRDAAGLRTRAGWARPKMPGVTRVLCLGASTTDQATQSWPDTWCGLLEEQLNRELTNSGITVEAASFGRGAMTASQSAMELDRLLPLYEPDVIVTLLGVNDITWMRGVESGEASQQSVCIPKASKLASICPTAIRLCRLIQRVNSNLFESAVSYTTTLEWHSDNLPTVRERFRRMTLVDHLDPSAKSLDQFKKAITNIAVSGRDKGVGVILLGQPVLWKSNLSEEEQSRLWFAVRTATGFSRVDARSLQTEMGVYNDAQRSIAVQTGVRYVDLEGQIPKDLRHFFDDCHYTDLGSRALAAVILPTVKNAVLERVAVRTP